MFDLIFIHIFFLHFSFNCTTFIIFQFIFIGLYFLIELCHNIIIIIPEMPSGKYETVRSISRNIGKTVQTLFYFYKVTNSL